MEKGDRLMVMDGEEWLYVFGSYDGGIVTTTERKSACRGYQWSYFQSRFPNYVFKIEEKGE